MIHHLDREFLAYTFKRYSTILMLIGALFTVSRPVINTVTSSENPPSWLPSQDLIPVYLSLILFLGILYTYIEVWNDYRENREKLDDLNTKLGELQTRSEPDRKRKESPEAILLKRLDVEIEEDGADTVSYEYKVKPVFDDGIVTEFQATIATNRDVDWETLNVREDGLEFVEKNYKPIGEADRYLITYELEEDAHPGSPSEFSYTFDQRVVNVDQDGANLVIDNPTRKCVINVIFPEGWKPVGYDCYNIPKGKYQDEDAWVRADEQPGRYKIHDDRWTLQWEGENPEEEHIYEVQWTAKKQ